MQEGNQMIFFPLNTIFFVTISELSISTGGKYMIFFNCSTFAGGVLGENILCLMFFPLAMLYGFYFTFLPRQLLGYELEEKQYNIFPPGPVFFLLVTQKLVKKLMGELI